MKNNQKGFIVPVLLAIIALLVIGSGVYVFQNKKTEVQTTNQTPPVNTQINPSSQTDTSNWKTYKNETYGYEYEVKYPSILSVAGKGSFANPSAINTPGSGIAFSIANENLLEAKGNEYLEYKGEIIIDGYKAKKYSRPLYISSTTIGAILYIVPEKNITILYFPYNAEYHKISESDMNHILSTFKFTK